MRAHLGDESRWLGSEESPWSANPGRGCGMKQARKVCAGVSRRERGKRCGRNVVGFGKPDVEWTVQADVAKGSETPRKVLGSDVEQVTSGNVL
jgi:hypothetical protein